MRGAPTRRAQAYVRAAVQRNRIESELSHITRIDKTVHCTLASGSEYEKLLGTKQLKHLAPNFGPSVEEVKSDSMWDKLLAAAAADPARQAALRGIIAEVHAEDAWTKVIVFAPEGAAFDSAAAALRQMKKPKVLIGDLRKDGVTDEIMRFAKKDIHDPDAPLVLLMSFERSSALNLQVKSECESSSLV